MAGQWDAWLRDLVADGKGGLGLPGRPKMRSIVRGEAYEYTFAIAMDMTADSFAASLRASPDAAGFTLADFTVTVGAFASGVTPITLSLPADAFDALLEDGDFDGLEEAVFDIKWTPAGGSEQRLMGGTITISGKVTN